MKNYFTALRRDHPLFQRLKKDNPCWWQFIKENIKQGVFYVDIRKDNSVDVYHNGGLLLKITSSGSEIKGEIHEHYLGKCGSKYVSYELARLCEGADRIKERMVSRFSDTSENGIKAKLRCSPGTNYIDSEFAYPEIIIDEVGAITYKTTRIDLTKLENGKIVFVELKRIEDNRLLTNEYEAGKPEILSQMEAYHQFAKDHKQEITDYYKTLFAIKRELGILPESLADIESIDDYQLCDNVELHIDIWPFTPPLTPRREKRVEAIKTILDKNKIIHNLHDLKITIHRGINQIGGCITEISTDEARILIDLGQNLPDGEGVVNDELSSREAIEDITKGIDAVFYTHYHGDHLGLFHYVPDSVRQYIGKVAKQVAIRKSQQLSYVEGREQLSGEEIAKLNSMGELAPKQTVIIGDIKVTPYFVSHSAYESYMFLIEADGKRILHTGDFRGHGYLSKGLMPTIANIILSHGQIDFLITEGTMLSRLGERVMSEIELRREAGEIMKRYKNVFVMCSSTDMERLATFYAANKQLKHKPLVGDSYQKDVLEIFTESAGAHTATFRFKDIYEYRPANTKLMAWMADKGFCMFVRATDKFKDYCETLLPQLNPNDTVLIYSMWKEYVNPDGKHAIQRYVDFVSMFPNLEKLHTSGHASADCLVEVCNLVNPTLGIIPIHAENSASYSNLSIGKELKEKIIVSSRVIGGVEVEITERDIA